MLHSHLLLGLEPWALQLQLGQHHLSQVLSQQMPMVQEEDPPQQPCLDIFWAAVTSAAKLCKLSVTLATNF